MNEIDNTKYFVKYKGEVMPLSQFARLIGVNYEMLRKRMAQGRPLDVPAKTVAEFAAPPLHKDSDDSMGYTMDELAEMYSRFRGTEEALYVLADLACLPRRGKTVRKLKQEIEDYLEQKYKEVHGK